MTKLNLSIINQIKIPEWNAFIHEGSPSFLKAEIIRDLNIRVSTFIVNSPRPSVLRSFITRIDSINRPDYRKSDFAEVDQRNHAVISQISGNSLHNSLPLSVLQRLSFCSYQVVSLITTVDSALSTNRLCPINGKARKSGSKTGKYFLYLLNNLPLINI
ncbi:MAG: hypothetical protein CM1200mP28_16280 [Deltaproteobacteria bacterium]|nr:MAG: hypothetical protein CM1200mP28_16280 [Deltaproteobacteria bacterium]